MDIVPGALRESSYHKQLVQLYWMARYDYEPNWAFREHIHDFAQIIYVIKGSGTAQLSGRNVTLGPGVVLFMVAGVPHALWADSDVPIRTIDAKFAILPGIFHDSLKRIQEPVLDKDNRVLHLLQRVLREAVKNQPGHYELGNALMTEALVVILRESIDSVPKDLPDPDVPLEDKLVKKALDLIHLRFSSDISLREVSGALGVSQQYLARRFKVTMGTTMQDYLIRYRIHKAKERLRYSRGPIKEIAFDVGFKSIHHFTRVFSRLEHMPPASWRERQSGIIRQGITVTSGFVGVDVTVDDRSNEPVGL